MHGEAESAFLAFRERGRPRDLARVFDLTAQELLLVAGHLARGGVEAEELVQQTFLAAIERRATWDPERPLVPWLLGILVRLARGERRRRAEERARSSGGVDALTSTAAGPPERASDAELAEALAAALATLPDAYRDVLSLRLVHGLEAVEIAHALGRPLETVKTQLKRGKERLRDALPRSLAALVALEGDGLSAVRNAVLAAAQGTTASTALATLGVALMGKKAVGAAVVLACAGALWWVRSAGDGEGDGAAEQVSAGAPLASPASEPERAAELVPAEAASREAVVTPDPAPLERATARLTCRVFFESGAPAEGVMLALWHTGLGRVPARPRAIADASGAVVFEGLPPGRAVVEADRGVRADVVLAAGDNEVELDIPAGVLVEGIVLDEREEPVADAELWLSGRFSNDGEGWWFVGSDPAGRFNLRDVWPNLALAARSPGRTPGEAVVVQGSPGDRVDVTLHTGTAGPQLQGVVRDGRGAPIAGAYLFAGYPPEGHLMVRDGVTYRSPPPQSVSTDERGHFELEAVPMGDFLPLWIAADGHAVGRERVSPERAAGPIVITLLRAARVTGTILDVDGAPLEKADVDVRQPSLDPVLAARRFGPHWNWTHAYTCPDGTFEIDALYPGPAELHASVRSLGESRASVELMEGETLEWSTVVTPADIISGFVTNELGEPIGGLEVRATSEGVEGERKNLQSTSTGIDGSFRLSGAVRERYRLRIGEKDADINAPLVLAEVAAGTEGLEVVYPDERRATARFVARILAHDGRPFVSDSIRIERVEANNTRSYGGERSRCTDGRLETGLLPPGDYRLSVRNADLGRVILGTFELSAGETRDLGDLVVPHPGRIELEVRDAAGQPLAAGAVTALSESSGMGTAITVRDGRGNAEALQPGMYVVVSDGYESPLAQQRVEVRSSETSHVVLELPAALTRWIEYPSMEGDGYVELEVAWTCDGRELCRKPGSGLVGGVVQRPLPMRLPPGRHAVTLTLPDGRSATTTFDVNENTTAPELAVSLQSPIGP